MKCSNNTTMKKEIKSMNMKYEEQIEETMNAKNKTSKASELDCPTPCGSDNPFDRIEDKVEAIVRYSNEISQCTESRVARLIGFSEAEESLPVPVNKDSWCYAIDSMLTDIVKNLERIHKHVTKL
jgi:hypothetical protein